MEDGSVKQGRRCGVSQGEGMSCPGVGPKHFQDRVAAAMDWSDSLK